MEAFVSSEASLAIVAAFEIPTVTIIFKARAHTSWLLLIGHFILLEAAADFELLGAA